MKFAHALLAALWVFAVTAEAQIIYRPTQPGTPHIVDHDRRAWILEGNTYYQSERGLHHIIDRDMPGYQMETISPGYTPSTGTLGPPLWNDPLLD